MIFEVDFGAAQTGIGYRFLSATGAYIGARVTTGINATPVTGVYLTTATVPAAATGIYWDCNDPNFTATEPIGSNFGSFPGRRRTVPFRKVLDAVVRRNGLEPDWDSSPHGRAAAICDHINTRVNTAWTYWDWPETMALEERAFRPAWDPTVAYPAGTDVFYSVDGNYYTALINTVAGQNPTVLTAWGPLSVTDKFIPLDAPGATPIDQVYGLYANNPRLYCGGRPLQYRMSEMGIDISGFDCSGSTVWIHFRVRPPEFTNVAHVMKAYSAGEIVFWPGDGECYGAVVDTANSVNPSVETAWRKMPMLEIFSRYVIAGAYADCLLESDPTATDAALISARNAKAKLAAAEAESYLVAQVDRLIAQGEHYRYNLSPVGRSRHRHIEQAVGAIPLYSG